MKDFANITEVSNKVTLQQGDDLGGFELIIRAFFFSWLVEEIRDLRHKKDLSTIACLSTEWRGPRAKEFRQPLGVERNSWLTAKKQPESCNHNSADDRTELVVECR